MPSPYRFLNLGARSAKEALRLAENRRVSIKDVTELGDVRRGFTYGGTALPEGIGRRGLGGELQTHQRFLDEQVRPAFARNYEDAPKMRLVVEKTSGRPLLQFLGGEPELFEWLPTAERIGFKRFGRSTSRVGDGMPDLFSFPEDPFLSPDRPFLHE